MPSAATIIEQATTPAVLRENERMPTRPLMAAPRPGRRGISQMYFIRCRLTFLLTPGPHPRRELTLTPRLGFPCPRLGVAAGAHHLMTFISSMLTVSLFR